jgi:2-amino-4-hydroxy-6-hydroxymethyldihydropteridine diphosphokinase
MGAVMSEARAFIALGANLPFEGVSPAVTLARAVRALEAACIEVRALSSLWETAPWPPSDQPNYFNAVAELAGDELEPQALYATLRAIEVKFGRARRARWDARTLDLDILALDGLVGAHAGLDLPHPRLHERAFVLAPLAEIAPEWTHPLLGRTASELLVALGPAKGYRKLDGVWANRARQLP